MTLGTDYPPIPGMWVARAQDALDALASMTTTDEVQATFRTARALVEAVLGTPLAGGAGTRRSVRATGRLITHRLGPALAADALSWAASVAEVMSPSSIEGFLEHAATAELTHCPVRLADRYQLLDHLRLCRSEAERRSTFLRLWACSSQRVDHIPSLPDDDDWALEWAAWRDRDAQADIDSWLPGVLGEEEPAGPATPTITGVYTARSDDAQVAAFDRLRPSQQREIARSHLLFDLATPIVQRCLMNETAAVIANPSCPPGLRERIRHPYDPATLELALRAGPGHFERARVRRLLEALDDEAHDRYLADVTLPYLTARRACGLNTPQEILAGRLAAIDLGDRATAEAVLGTAETWKWRRVPAEVVEVLLHHPQAPALGWTVAGRVAGTLVPELAERLVLEAPEAIASLAIRSLRPAEIDLRHANAAITAGPYWTARCPGIAGAIRPARLIPDANERFESANRWDDHDRSRSANRSVGERFEYPNVLEALERPYPEAPGWSVTLPPTAAALMANAEAMRNCTGSYEAAIRANRTYILVIESPTGTRYNAAVDAVACTDGTTAYRLGQVNSWANNGQRPGWLATAFQRRLAGGDRSFEDIEPAPPSRRPSSHRDRRRAQARRARQKR